MSIAIQTRALATSAVVTTREIERVWIAYAPSPDRRTPGKPPNHSPANGWYDVDNGGAVYASPRPYPATMRRASHAARSRTTHAVSAATATLERAKIHQRSRSPSKPKFRTWLPPDKARPPIWSVPLLQS